MVMCRAPIPRPSLCPAASRASSRLSRLASGSPMPMTTTLDNRPSGAGVRLRRRTSCSRISPAVRLRTTPFRPLAQNTHPMPQPTCVLMQAVRRGGSWISTHSIMRPSLSLRTSLCVSSEACRCRSTCVARGVNWRANSARRSRGKSDICSNDSARPATSILASIPSILPVIPRIVRGPRPGTTRGRVEARAPFLQQCCAIPELLRCSRIVVVVFGRGARARLEESRRAVQRVPATLAPLTHLLVPRRHDLEVVGADAPPGPSILAQELERVVPVVAQEARDAPEHAEGLDGTGSFGLAHVRGLPAELIENDGDGLFRRLVVAADEHRRPATREVRVHHEGIADGVEGLDEARVGKLALQALQQ